MILLSVVLVVLFFNARNRAAQTSGAGH